MVMVRENVQKHKYSTFSITVICLYTRSDEINKLSIH